MFSKIRRKIGYIEYIHIYLAIGRPIAGKILTIEKIVVIKLTLK